MWPPNAVAQINKEIIYDSIENKYVDKRKL